MHILLTGGGGLIGTHLLKDLNNSGHDLAIYDSFKNYIVSSDNTYQKYIEKRLEWINNMEIEIKRGDIRNKSEFRRVLDEIQPDCVVHLAALAVASKCNEYSEEATNVNLQGTINILEAIRDVDAVQRLVYASSSMVYGDFQYRPADEDHPKNPKGIYGGTKYSGEVLTRAYANQFNFEYVIVRPSAVYGPTDANRRVSQIFVEQALKNKPLELHDGGTQKLDFTFVEDTAQGFSLAATHEDAANNTFNITRGEGRSIKELAETIGGYVGEFETVETKADMTRPKRGALDIQKAREKLGYEPQYSLEDGINEYIDFVIGMGGVE